MKFELLAFVNDVDQAAMEGTDGIEHMYGNQLNTLIAFLIIRYCGHRLSSVVEDSRPYGFPFNKKIAMDLASLKNK